MTQNFYYEDVKVIKKPLKKRLKAYLIFFGIFLVMGGIVFSALFISNTIAVSNISTIFVYGGKDIKFDERNMYAVSLGSYDTIDEANKVAIGSTIQGSAGYVWVDKQYYVLGSIYSTQELASKVINNLQGTQYNISILQIKLPKINLTFDEYDNKQVSSIGDAVATFQSVYDKVYGYSIAFDKGEMNNLAISTQLSSIRGEIKGYISTMQSILSMPNAKVQEIQKSLIRLDELLDQAIIKTIDNSSTASYLKYAICSVVSIEYDLRQKLA